MPSSAENSNSFTGHTIPWSSVIPTLWHSISGRVSIVRFGDGASAFCWLAQRWLALTGYQFPFHWCPLSFFLLFYFFFVYTYRFSKNLYIFHFLLLILIYWSIFSSFFLSFLNFVIYLCIFLPVFLYCFFFLTLCLSSFLSSSLFLLLNSFSSGKGHCTKSVGSQSLTCQRVWTVVNRCKQVWTGVNRCWRCRKVWTSQNRCEVLLSLDCESHTPQILPTLQWS